MSSRTDRFKKIVGGLSWKKLALLWPIAAVALGFVATGYAFGFKNPKTFAQTVVHHVHAFMDHWDELRRLDEEYRRTALENGRLRRWVEETQYACELKQSAVKTQSAAHKNEHETGTPSGRTVASTGYAPPENLVPNQLYTLGVKYFEVGEYEKAAVIFTRLTEYGPLPEFGRGFKTAKHYLLTGVAWYRVDNLKMADKFFSKVVQNEWEHEMGLEQYQAQAQLWRALVSHRGRQPAAAQEQIRELVGKHPYSREAKWVNPTAHSHQ